MTPSKSTAQNRKAKERQIWLPETDRSIIVKADSTKKGLSDLPGEVRNRIYRLALTDRGPAHFSPTTPIPLPLKSDPTVYHDLGIGLLQTCKAIHRETIGIFYHENTFRIDLLHHNMGAPSDVRAGCDAWVFQEYDELGRPMLDDALKHISAKNVARMRSFIFVYNRRGHELASGRTFDPAAMPLMAISLDFLNSAPYYQLNLLGTDGEWDTDEEWGIWEEDHTFYAGQYEHDAYDDLAPVVEDMIRSKDLRRLSGVDMLEIADCIRQHCQDRYCESNG